MLKLEKGRPADCAGRLGKEVRTYDFLDKLNIEYERIDHEAAMTMEECADVDEALGAMICKNLFLCNRQETTFYLLMIPGDKKFKTKDLSAQIRIARETKEIYCPIAQRHGISKIKIELDDLSLKYLEPRFP